MKTVLCYGDSNTWGYNPKGGRFDYTIRWPMVMASFLNSESDGKAGSADAYSYWVVEEGLNGRTTCREDPVEGDKNGLRQLVPILRSHKPLDLVIIMLGTNDLKHRFNPNPYEISQGAQLVAKAALASESGPNDGKPKVLLVNPVPLSKSKVFAQMLASDAQKISRKLAPLFKTCAAECGAEFFDSSSVIKACSRDDGIHWDADDHRRFGKAMAEQVRILLG